MTQYLNRRYEKQTTQEAVKGKNGGKIGEKWGKTLKNIREPYIRVHNIVNYSTYNNFMTLLNWEWCIRSWTWSSQAGVNVLLQSADQIVFIVSTVFFMYIFSNILLLGSHSNSSRPSISQFLHLLDLNLLNHVAPTCIPLKYGFITAIMERKVSELLKLFPRYLHIIICIPTTKIRCWKFAYTIHE